MNTDRFLTIPAEEYHAASKCGRYMSSHNLAAFRESLELYHHKTSGEIAEGESSALVFGRPLGRARSQVVVARLRSFRCRAGAARNYAGAEKRESIPILRSAKPFSNS